jgi:hypothetical protein
MPDQPDWSAATFEGNRQRQRLEFLALSFRDKIRRIEEMNEVAGRMRPVRPDAERPAEANKDGERNS